MTALRVAIRLPNTNRVVSVDALARVCQTAEELGFYAVSADDHIVFDGSYISCGSVDAVGEGEDHDKLEVVAALSFAAAWTERVRLLAGSCWCRFASRSCSQSRSRRSISHRAVG